jgi:hypothetical protein
VRELQVPAIGFWVDGRGGVRARPAPCRVGPSGQAADHGADDAQHRFRRRSTETDDRAYFIEFAARGYAFAVNALLYAMTH